MAQCECELVAYVSILFRSSLNPAQACMLSFIVAERTSNSGCL